ncbi:hypothetical protein Trydic_g10299 [Trypoxylus dichotomus]
MACLKSLLVCFVVVLAVALGAPTPGGLGGSHEHHIFHVPYNVHTIHHHHVKKIVVPVPIVKKVPRRMVVRQDGHMLEYLLVQNIIILAKIHAV